ncbi:MAG TPA: tetratricopeptide repeat protein [Streptosporangiaceae bacterium]|nr:tetratricopeptide repeat protein [Streptosporangiaceae bacterium]
MTANTTLHNLPAEPNDFIGRERDLAELRQLLGATRAVTLCGPGGIGKTRLALRVAATLADGCPDGVWFAGLGELAPEAGAEANGTGGPAGPGGPGGQGRGADSDLVVRRVTAALGITDEPGRSLSDTLAGALRGRNMLLVLDNCEHLIDACARFCQTLLADCPQVRILATSREPLRVQGENVWRVPPLATPARAGGAGALAPVADGPGPSNGVQALRRNEAVRLFVARAASARPSFALDAGNAAAVGELCRALDGVPLAIELAAARTRVLSVDEITRLLRDRFRLLSVGDRTAPARQRTLRGTIDWSHDLLDRPERVLFRRLSVFAGEWTLDQAERVCADAAPADGAGGGLPADDVLDLLTALVDKSLVVVGPEVEGETRFRMLDSIRAYATGRLADAGEADDLGRRHRDVVLATAEDDAKVALAERPASWEARVGLFRRYDTELDNVRAALAWSLAHGDVDAGLRLCTALRTYCIPRGYFAECEHWTDRFLAHGRDGVRPGVWGAALVGRAQLAVGRRDFEKAARCAAEGLEPCRAAGDTVMTAAALDLIGQTELRAGRFDSAAAHFDEAIAIARAGGDRWNEGLALISRGALRAVLGRLREAQQAYEAGVRLMREVRQLWGAGRGLIGLGQLARLRGDGAAARTYYEEALPGLRMIDAGPEIARCLSGIGRVALDQGDTVRARRALTDSLLRSRAHGMRLGVARGLEAFAELLALEGEPHTAVRLGGAAAALRESIGQAPIAGARQERMLAPIRRRLGEHVVAQLWGDGRETPPEAAIALALAPPGPAIVPPQRPAADDRIDLTAPPAPPAPAPPRDVVAPVSATAGPVTPPSTLTPREREIAVLIARGLSNKGIADELVISPATVARHVTNILTKLGFVSRAQIAAWAVNQGPDLG